MGWKRKNRKRTLKSGVKKISGLFFIVIILLAFFFIFKSNFFSIRFLEIYKEKADCIDDMDIEQTSNLKGGNIFFINFSDLENRLKVKFYCIKNIELSKKYPDKVRLSVFGRQPVLILITEKEINATSSAKLLEQFSGDIATGSAEASKSAEIFAEENNNLNESFLIDEEGIPYSKNTDQIDAPRVFSANMNIYLGQKIKGNIISGTLKIMQNLKIFGVSVNSAKIYSEKYLLINGEPKIVFRLNGKEDVQIASLQLILKTAKMNSNMIEFIDLRFDKPVVKFAPKKK